MVYEIAKELTQQSRPFKPLRLVAGDFLSFLLVMVSLHDRPEFARMHRFYVDYAK